MNIVYAKFFQAIQVGFGASGSDTINSAQVKDYNLVLDGQFLKVQSKKGGPVTYVTLYNTCFLRTDNDSLDASPETSPKGPTKAKPKQD